jgi:hypothetical protein
MATVTAQDAADRCSEHHSPKGNCLGRIPQVMSIGGERSAKNAQGDCDGAGRDHHGCSRPRRHAANRTHGSVKRPLPPGE